MTFATGCYSRGMNRVVLITGGAKIFSMYTSKETFNGEVVIRPMMYVALTYDHRVVDGKGAVSFLVRIKQAIEDPSRILLEV